MNKYKSIEFRSTLINIQNFINSIVDIIEPRDEIKKENNIYFIHHAYPTAVIYYSGILEN